MLLLVFVHSSDAEDGSYAVQQRFSNEEVRAQSGMHGIRYTRTGVRRRTGKSIHLIVKVIISFLLNSYL